MKDQILLSNMKHLSKFNEGLFDFFKKKEAHQFIDRILINLEKEIDSICDDSIWGVEINNVKILNKIGKKPLNDFSLSKDKRANFFGTEIDQSDLLSTRNITITDIDKILEPIRNNPFPTKESIGGSILILLSKDDSTFFVISICYNLGNKFDLNTCSELLITKGSIHDNFSKYHNYIRFADQNNYSSFFTKLGQYMIDNKLCGHVIK